MFFNMEVFGDLLTVKYCFVVFFAYSFWIADGKITDDETGRNLKLSVYFLLSAQIIFHVLRQILY